MSCIYSAERQGIVMHEAIFPKEVIAGVPRLTLTGRERLHVEQHQGLLDYEPEHIVLRTVCGLLRVTGAGMGFQMYTAAEAVITGRIDQVSFAEREGRG